MIREITKKASKGHKTPSEAFHIDIFWQPFVMAFSTKVKG